MSNLATNIYKAILAKGRHAIYVVAGAVIWVPHPSMKSMQLEKNGAELLGIFDEHASVADIRDELHAAGMSL